MSYVAAFATICPLPPQRKSFIYASSANSKSLLHFISSPLNVTGATVVTIVSLAAVIAVCAAVIEAVPQDVSGTVLVTGKLRSISPSLITSLIIVAKATAASASA